MQKTKSLFASLTIQGAVLSLIATLLAAFGINLAPEAMPELNTILAGLGAVIAIVGRIRAKTLILPPADPPPIR